MTQQHSSVRDRATVTFRNRDLPPSFHTKVAFIAVLLYVFFGIAFIAESVAHHFIQAFYISGVLLYVRVVVMTTAAMGMLIFLTLAAKISRHVILLSLIGFLVLAFSAVAGFFFQNSVNPFFSHFQYYLSFIIVLMTCAFLTRLDATKLIVSIKRMAYGLLVAVFAIILFVYLTTPPEFELSLNMTLAIFPLAYFLSATHHSNSYGKLVSTIIIFLTMKRGLWITAVIGLMIGGVKLRRRHLLRNGLGIALLFVLTLSAMLSGGIDIQKPFLNLIERLATRFEFDGTDLLSNVDAISSGRLGNMFAILGDLQHKGALFSGLGFGATIDLNSGTVLAEWITSGADVILLHFWMLHGVLIGTILIGALTWFVFKSFKNHIILKDQWFSFWFFILALSYVSAWFTFVPWDPVWPISIGLLIARKRQIMIEFRQHRHAIQINPTATNKDAQSG